MTDVVIVEHECVGEGDGVRNDTKSGQLPGLDFGPHTRLFSSGREGRC